MGVLKKREVLPVGFTSRLVFCLVFCEDYKKKRSNTRMTLGVNHWLPFLYPALMRQLNKMGSLCIQRLRRATDIVAVDAGNILEAISFLRHACGALYRADIGGWF